MASRSPGTFAFDGEGDIGFDALVGILPSETDLEHGVRAGDVDGAGGVSVTAAA